MTGGQGGGGAFDNNIIGNLGFIKIDLKQFYCGYSRAQNI